MSPESSHLLPLAPPLPPWLMPCLITVQLNSLVPFSYSYPSTVYSSPVARVILFKMQIRLQHSPAQTFQWFPITLRIKFKLSGTSNPYLFCSSLDFGLFFLFPKSPRLLPPQGLCICSFFLASLRKLAQRDLSSPHQASLPIT